MDRRPAELADSPWMPELVREAHREVLGLACRYAGLGRVLLPPFEEVLEASSAATVLDLCSGAGGPLVPLLEALAERGGRLPKATLSDLRPSPRAWTKAGKRLPGVLDFVDAPVDAARLPGDVEADLVTVVNGLHHLGREAVVRMVAEVVARGSSLFVAEPFPRSPLRAMALFPAAWLASLVNPFVCGRAGLLKALLTFPIPLLPFLGFWDGVQSARAVHDPAALVAAGRDLAPHYEWRHGSVPFAGFGRAEYVWGAPRRRYNRR